MMETQPGTLVADPSSIDQSMQAALALGAADGVRIRVPHDPVSAFMLPNVPGMEDVSITLRQLATARARARAFDEAVVEQLVWAELGRKPVTIWDVGVGLSGRWYPILSADLDFIQAYVEVDEAPILRMKDAALEGSDFISVRDAVQRRAANITEWTIEPTKDGVDIVVIGAASVRLDEVGVATLLDRLLADAPGARVLLDVPVEADGVNSRWSARAMANRGWRIIQDTRCHARGDLYNGSNVDGVPGSESYRLVLIEPA